MNTPHPPDSVISAPPPTIQSCTVMELLLFSFIIDEQNVGSAISIEELGDQCKVVFAGFILL